MPPLTPTIISKSAFLQTLSRYPSTVPAKLHDLDEQRYTSIPALVTARRQSSNTATTTNNDNNNSSSSSAYLTKLEVLNLVEWKLKHGTFRPKLLQLVASNAESLVEDTTREAFSTLSSSSSPMTTSEDILAALKILTALKGVGPATASLFLSVYEPERVPFFSDELFRWVMWEEPISPVSLPSWKRGIKYTAKEYAEVVGRVEAVRERLGVRAVECERVAWVLGREGVNVGGGRDEEGERDKDGEVEAKIEEGESKAEGKVERKKGTKRKAASEGKAAIEGTRRSSRRK
ncbi:hypothetical protein CC80DRAFT_383232, partial [Byssothecium circinans]